MPGNASTVAIALKSFEVSPRHTGVAVYDDGIRRPVMTASHVGSNVIEFGSTPSRLYGYNSETSAFGVPAHCDRCLWP